LTLQHHNSHNNTSKYITLELLLYAKRAAAAIIEKIAAEGPTMELSDVEDPMELEMH
jgi:hypothetical protein